MIFDFKTAKTKKCKKWFGHHAKLFLGINESLFSTWARISSTEVVLWNLVPSRNTLIVISYEKYKIPPAQYTYQEHTSVFLYLFKAERCTLLFVYIISAKTKM